MKVVIIGGVAAGPKAAAKALGIHRATLFRKIKSLGIPLPDGEAEQAPPPASRTLRRDGPR
jgi:hypothetical protein